MRTHRPSAAPARPDDRYGTRRLRALYEITKLLGHYSAAPEDPFMALVRIMTRELPLRVAILIDRFNGGAPRSVAWRAADVSAPDAKAAEARAKKAFAAITRPPSPAKRPSRAEGGPSPFEGSAKTGRFVTSPLIIQGEPIFGALRLEGAAPFDEEDLEFVTAIANQLAISLDRNRARRQELALRAKADASTAEVIGLNAELERRVKERTAQFQDTIKELNAFTYSIAHDLRAPLRHIHGFSQRLMAAASDGPSKDYARRIMAASEGMDVLIKDLLSYSRLTLEEVKLEPVSLQTILSKARVALEGEISARGARIEVEGELPRVLGHETTLIQTVINLLSNAVKFTGAGVEPRIRVKAEIRRRHVRLWVEDNGLGIAPEYHERIFGVFQRLNKAEDYAGTGIGLAIVRRALDRMKGSSGVESRPGLGSRFWIELESADAR